MTTIRVDTLYVNTPDLVNEGTKSGTGSLDGTMSNQNEKGTHMGTTTTIERERALAWIARQLRWERTLADLRDTGDEPVRQAA